jgi:membrane-associated protein
VLHSLAATTALLDLTGFLSSLGWAALLIVALFIVIETGLMFPFLPGDSLIFTIALLSPALHLPLGVVIAVAAASAIAGDQIGFAIGRRFGRRLFRPDARLFKTRYLDEADRFFRRFGPPAIVLARFVPIVRTFIAPAVGASTLRHRTFTVWNAIGGIGWALALGLAGFYLGRIPVIRDNIEIFGLGVVVVSVIPIVVGAVLRRRRARRERDTGVDESAEPAPADATRR